MPLAPGTRLGVYEVGALIGAGGMGEVYKARDTRLDRTVAIKVLPAALAADPERRARFEREARAISRLSHPHICALFDVGTASLPGPWSARPENTAAVGLLRVVTTRYQRRDVLGAALRPQAARALSSA